MRQTSRIFTIYSLYDEVIASYPQNIQAGLTIYDYISMKQMSLGFYARHAANLPDIDGMPRYVSVYKWIRQVE